MNTCPFEKEQLASSTGMPLTMGLFYEFRHQGEATPIYTLKEHDWKGCKSMYKIYVSCSSEYEAAIKILGSWSHWKKLCKCTWFKPYLEDWKEEVLIREAAIGKATLIEAAEDGNVTAAKELVNQLNKKSAGRPSKKDQEKDKHRRTAIDQKVVSILERAGNV